MKTLEKLRKAAVKNTAAIKGGNITPTINVELQSHTDHKGR